jgi:hypothetical protein
MVFFSFSLGKGNEYNVNVVVCLGGFFFQGR